MRRGGIEPERENDQDTSGSTRLSEIWLECGCKADGASGRPQPEIALAGLLGSTWLIAVRQAVQMREGG
jgi:hypothetical protein